MLIPQWQTKTPIRGDSPRMSTSCTNSLETVSVPRAGARITPAAAAAPLASTTDWGMSWGPRKAPQANIPGLEVASGWKDPERQKRSGSSSNPSRSAISTSSADVCMPTERTTRSKTSSLKLLASSTYERTKLSVRGSGSMEWTRERRNRTPCSCLARS